MSSRVVLGISAILITLLAGLAVAKRDQPARTKTDADAKRELMDADLAFVKATAENGLDGWLSCMADDAVRISPLGGQATAGKTAIRKMDAPLFADPKRLLVWEPIDAGVFADGKHGFTTGRAKLVNRSAEKKDDGSWTVKYVTWWRKGEDGRWKVILDTGATDPPKP